MGNHTANKSSRISRVLMIVLTVVLIFSFFDIMSLVADIQGTARVVNYAGLVRGTTQRIVKTPGSLRTGSSRPWIPISTACAMEAAS